MYAGETYRIQTGACAPLSPMLEAVWTWLFAVVDKLLAVALRLFCVPLPGNT